MKRSPTLGLAGSAMALAIAFAALVGCAEDTSPSSTANGDTSPILIPSQESYPASLLQGPLELHDGCLVVQNSILLLPEGTSWTPATQELVIDSTTFEVGDDIELGGGEVPADLVEDLAGEAERQAAENCLDRGVGEVLFLVSGL